MLILNGSVMFFFFSVIKNCINKTFNRWDILFEAKFSKNKTPEDIMCHSCTVHGLGYISHL